MLTDQDYTVHGVHLVTPHLPTVLGDVDLLPLPPTELVFTNVPGIFVFPGPLDIAKFKGALARTLHDYPHAAGRLQCIDKKWSIKLTNSPVTVTVGSSRILTEELVHVEEPHPHAVDSPPFSLPNSFDEPLMKVRLTTWEKTGDTSLGITWSHILGDGVCEYQFFTAFLQYYLGNEPLPSPTFEKYFNQSPVLERTLLQETLPLVPYLSIDYSPEVFNDMYNKMQSSTSHIDIQFTCEQLQAFRTAATKSAGAKVSEADALVAYIVTVLNRISPTPIRQIVNWVNFRGVGVAPGSDWKPPGLRSAGNNVIGVYADKMATNASMSLGALAAYMRNTMKIGREPEFVRRVVALTEELRERYLDTLDKGREPWWWTYDNHIGVSNLYRAAFTSMHLGYPGKVRIYVFGTFERVFRIWPGNPQCLADGSWQSNEGSMRVMTRLKHELKDRFLKVIAEDMQDLGQSVAKL